MFYRENTSQNFGIFYDAKIPEPVFLAQAPCLSDEITIPYLNSVIKKESFGIFVVIIDLLVVITILLFICILDARQNEYIKVFKDKTI